MMRRLFATLLFTTALWAQDRATVTSPNGRIVYEIFDGPPAITESVEPHLQYHVLYDGKPLIEASYLGFDIDQQIALGHKLAIYSQNSSKIDETYTLSTGKAKTVRNQYNELLVDYLQNGSLGRRMTMEVRAYNDGVAFRYFVPPTQRLDAMQILNEMTEFRFAKDAAGYPLELDGYQTGYQGEHRRATLSGIHQDAMIAMPFLVEQPGVAWVAVTEAEIKNYGGSSLVRTGARTFQVHISPRVDGSGFAVDIPTPMETPWRVLMIADRPEQLIESNLVMSVNPDSQIADTSWIQPGKAASNAWAGKADTATIAQCIDFAAASGLEYVVIADGWTATGRTGYADLLKPAPDVDLPALLERAREKKVGLWLSAPWRSVESQIDQAFPQFEKWGVRGVRVEGMNREDQQMVDFYRLVAKKAAEHHLMVAFADAYKPDGIEREFPNVLTRTASLTLDDARWGALANPAENVMLAFTRSLAGPLDDRLGGFENVTPAQFAPREPRPMTLGTRAHQLALYVVFESPLQMVSDTPEAYTSGTREFEFIRDVPVTWDETRAIGGKVGDFVVLARRKGSAWFIGAITNGDAREIDLPLSFLGSGEFSADVYADAADAAENPKHTEISPGQRVNAGSRLHLKLAPGGGAAIHIRSAR